MALADQAYRRRASGPLDQDVRQPLPIDRYARTYFRRSIPADIVPRSTENNGCQNLREG
jgi:hypothetical protein